MRVLADFHHQGLFHSLQLLFEKRLGWELYRCIGTEWHDEGYWMVYNHPTTVKQYLGLQNGVEASSFQHDSPLNAYHQYNLFNQEYDIVNGIYYVKNRSFNTLHKAVRLQTFKDMEFDIVISSIPAHIDRFNKLIQKHQPKAKHVFQVGNNWGNLPGVKNILASTRPFKCSQNAVFYHQEFELDIFKYSAPARHDVLNSYVHFMKKSEYLKRIRHQLAWEGKAYGGGMDDALKNQGVADAMAESAFTWHYKPGGDGYGHVVHSTMACGRPPIIWGSQYKDCLAESLFEHGKTCIDAEKFSNDSELVNYIKECAVSERHSEMCIQAYERFSSLVDFDKEEQNIRGFLGRLQ